MNCTFLIAKNKKLQCVFFSQDASRCQLFCVKQKDSVCPALSHLQCLSEGNRWNRWVKGVGSLFKRTRGSQWLFRPCSAPPVEPFCLWDNNQSAKLHTGDQGTLSGRGGKTYPAAVQLFMQKVHVLLSIKEKSSWSVKVPRQEKMIRNQKWNSHKSIVPNPFNMIKLNT